MKYVGFPRWRGIGTEAAMARTRYAPDRGLIARMGATMFLLGLVFTAFIIVIVLLLTRYSNVSNGGIVFIAVLFGAGISFGSFYWSDKIALSTAGARLVSPQQAPELHGVIDRICALADMPKPRVAIAPTDLPNAFATGRSSKVAVICVTQGLLNRLDTNELEGVLAHEMSHVAHKDVAVMTIASFLGIMAALLVRFAFYSELFGGGGRGRGRGGNNNQNALPVILIVMLVGMVVYAISFLLIRLLSRYRELSADRSGALLTGQPSALASALVKVTGDMARIPTRDLRAAEPLNAFYFAPALSATRGQMTLSNIFSTHPSLEKRLANLEKISQQLSK
jgi:heat shock protein HtpX